MTGLPASPTFTQITERVTARHDPKTGDGYVNVSVTEDNVRRVANTDSKNTPPNTPLSSPGE